MRSLGSGPGRQLCRAPGRVPVGGAPRAPAAPWSAPLVVGFSHRWATAALRDRLYLEPAAVPAFLARMRRAGPAPGMVVSTCDRTQLTLIDHGPAGLADRAIDLFAEQAGMGPAGGVGRGHPLPPRPAPRARSSGPRP